MIRFLGETEVNSPDALLDASSSFFVMPYINLLRGSEMRTNYFRTIQGIFKSQLLRYFIIYEYFYHIRISLKLQWYGYNRSNCQFFSVYIYICIYKIMCIGTRTISNGFKEALWIREIGQLPTSDNSCVSRQKAKNLRSYIRHISQKNFLCEILFTRYFSNTFMRATEVNVYDFIG